MTRSDHHTPSPPLSEHNPANVINNTSVNNGNLLLDPVYWAGLRQNIWAAPNNPFLYRPPPPHMMNYLWRQTNQQAAAAASALGIKPPKVPIMPSMDPRQSLEGGEQVTMMRAAPLVMKPPEDDSDSPTSLDSMDEGISTVPRKILGEMQAAKEQFLAETKTIDVETITVQEMKAILKKFGLITTGKKKELFNRIIHTRNCLLTANSSSSRPNDSHRFSNDKFF